MQNRIKESDVEKYFVDSIQNIRGEVRKLKWIGRRGAPDRIVFYRGKIYLVELKSPTGKLRPEQMREHERLYKQGIGVYVLYNLGEVTNFIREITQDGKQLVNRLRSSTQGELTRRIYKEGEES